MKIKGDTIYYISSQSIATTVGPLYIYRDNYKNIFCVYTTDSSPIENQLKKSLMPKTTWSYERRKRIKVSHKKTWDTELQIEETNSKKKKKKKPKINI
jgi:hypothetical protein